MPFKNLGAIYTMVATTSLTSLSLLTLTTSAQAHHSFAAAYDLQDPIEIKGAIVEVRLTNPHSHFFLDVMNDKGETVRWKVEAGTPSGMIRNGYSPKIIKAGDIVTIKGFRARNESSNGMLRELILADGTVYGMFGPQQSAGAK
jgi:DNA/RNA endonuclease YhcR with UshA esterase domain